MTVLTVCTGNTCRSPFAAAYLNKLFLENGIDAKAFSAGLFVRSGESPCAAAVKAAGKYGVSDEMASHVSRQLSDDDILASDIVFAVGENHYNILLPKINHINSARRDGKKTELYLLGDGLFDPYGGDERDYDKCYGRIAECARLVAQKLSK